MEINRDIKMVHEFYLNNASITVKLFSINVARSDFGLSRFLVVVTSSNLSVVTWLMPFSLFGGPIV